MFHHRMASNYMLVSHTVSTVQYITRTTVARAHKRKVNSKNLTPAPRLILLGEKICPVLKYYDRFSSS